jgi:hypothetical protein
MYEEDSIVCSLTLAILAIANILNHDQILRIVATSESISNSCDVRPNVSLEVGSKARLRAVGAITLSNFCVGKLI